MHILAIIREASISSSSINTGTHNWLRCRKEDMNADVYMEHIYHTFPFQGSGIIVEEMAERLQEPEVTGDKERVCNEHSRAATHTNSQWL